MILGDRQQALRQVAHMVQVLDLEGLKDFMQPLIQRSCSERYLVMLQSLAEDLAQMPRILLKLCLALEQLLRYF